MGLVCVSISKDVYTSGGVNAIPKRGLIKRIETCGGCAYHKPVLFFRNGAFPVVFTKNFKEFGLVVAGVSCFVMQGCSTQEAETIEVQKPTFEQTMFDLTNGAGAIDPLEMASRSSGKNVKVFPFDKNGVSVSGISLKAPEGMSAQYVSDPSVEVFPLDAPQQGGLRDSSVDGPLLPPADVLLGQSGGDGKPVSPNFVSIQAPGEPVTRIYFDHDSANLDTSDMTEISQITARFNPNREDYVLSVEGHASVQSSEKDPVQRRIVNMRVATDRAYNVARALMESGIAPEKIRTVSWGESVPSPAHDGMSADEASRRVEIFRLK